MSKAKKLGTNWFWKVYTKDGEKVFDVVYGASKDGRRYRVAKCSINRGKWRADVAGLFGYAWEALNSVLYETPDEAAKEIAKLHREWLREKREREEERAWLFRERG